MKYTKTKIDYWEPFKIRSYSVEDAQQQAIDEFLEDWIDDPNLYIDNVIEYKTIDRIRYTDRIVIVSFKYDNIETPNNKNERQRYRSPMKFIKDHMKAEIITPKQWKALNLGHTYDLDYESV